MPAIHSFFNEVFCATDGCMRAWKVENSQVPRIINHLENIALIMRAGNFGWQQVATHGFMSASDKRIAHNTREFAANENAHQIRSRAVSMASVGQ